MSEYTGGSFFHTQRPDLKSDVLDNQPKQPIESLEAQFEFLINPSNWENLGWLRAG